MDRAHTATEHVSAEDTPGPIYKRYEGMDYRIFLQPNDSSIYLDIDGLGLHHHKVHTNCPANNWGLLEREADRAALTIIDLHKAAPKGLL